MPDPFSWHPEPELIGFRDPRQARGALEALGSATWDLSLDYLYEEASRRPVGFDSYPELRKRFFGPSAAPSSPPRGPETSGRLLAEYRERVMPYLFNSQHPGAYSYFTPPPLPISIAGEILGQWTQQGVDVWHAGPIAALVEEEVTAWLRDLVGFGEGSWGVLTSGGVMANIMAMTVARDRHLARLLGLLEPPRGARLDGVRVYASDQTHFSIARALEVLGFPPETLRVLPSDERFRLHAQPWPKRSPRTVRSASSRSPSRRWPARRTPAAWTCSASSRTWPSARVCGSTSTRRTGAPRVLGARRAPCARLERADSVTVDPHKWFFQAYDIGGLVVKSREDLRETFHKLARVLPVDAARGRAAQLVPVLDRGDAPFPGAQALVLLEAPGHRGLRAADRPEHRPRRAPGARCRELRRSRFSPRRRSSRWCASATCPDGLDPEHLDAYQDRLQRALEVSGEGWVSTTRLRGTTYLRAGVVNYLSTEEDVDRVLDALERLSPEAARELG